MKKGLYNIDLEKESFINGSLKFELRNSNEIIIIKIKIEKNVVLETDKLIELLINL